jgi:segregation and condensation protein B
MHDNEKTSDFWDEFDEVPSASVEEADLKDVVGRDEDFQAFDAMQSAKPFGAVGKKKSVNIDDEDAPCLKGEIEALLFITNRPLHMEDMALLLERPLDEVVDAVSELLSDYNFREDCSLEIDDSEEGYILQVRKPYQHLVNKMIPMDISTAALRTLSVIAIKSPLLQKELIDLRGATAYDHVKELLNHKLISKNRSGVSYRLNVTPTFHQLFKLSGDKKDLDVLVESELGLEKEQRQQALKAPLDDITSLDDLALSASLDD